MSEKLIFYRFHDEETINGLVVREQKFIMLRETPRGHWIIPDYMSNYLKQDRPFAKRMVERSKRWVSKTSMKRYAYPTQKEALGNLMCRKRSQIKHSKYFLDRAKDALSRATDMFNKLGESAAA